MGRVILNMNIESSVTVREAAERLGVSQSRVRKLCDIGGLKATKFGDVWVIDEQSLQERIANPPKPGNPNFKKKNVDTSDE